MKSGERLLSLDVFRGATIAAMILVNNAGDWNNVYAPLLHAQWHGWTFTDLIFPSFLWIAGVAMTLSFAKRVEAGASRQRLLPHVLRRAALLFALGLFLNGFPFFPLDRLRIPGVLQRIAICYLAAAAIYLYTRVRGQALILAGLLAVYWMLMAWTPVPGCGAGALERDCNFAKYVDGLFLSGHMYPATKTWDPEGIVSTLPSIATTLFGVLTGHLLRYAAPLAEKAAWMLTGGAALLAAGSFWDHFLPINKNIWTSSYAVFAAGMSMSGFGCCYWLIDGRGWKRFVRPFAIYGSNAITVYALSGMLARTLGLVKIGEASLKQVIYQGVFVPLGSPRVASLLYAIAFVLVLYAVAWYMYRRKWFVKL